MGEVKYEVWKKMLWEAWRVFGLAFLAVIFAQFEAGVDLREWRSWAYSLVLSAGVAGLKAIGKYARAKLASSYESFIYKLPF